MPLFEDRERAEEARYARSQEVTFRVKARRNKLLAAWAAEKMGKTGSAARQYAGEFAVRDITDGTDEMAIARINADLLAQGIFVPEAEIRRHLDRFAASAAKAYKSGTTRS
jgi:hypothetical protein